MAILAFGGEMGFFLPSDANSIEATANLHGGGIGGYDPNFARCYTKAYGSSAYVETPSVGAQAGLWVHMDIDQGSFVSSDSTLDRLVEFIDGGGIAQLRITASWNGTWQLEKWTGTAWSSLGSCSASSQGLQTLDIHIVSNTTSGSADLYMSGTKRIASGTVNLSGFTGITKLRCYGVSRGISSDCAYSQVVLATEPTIGMRVGTIAMTGQGATHTFDIGGYANIDEVVYSDADFDQSGTAGQIELFTGTPVPSFNGYTIRALALTARAKTDGTAPTKLDLALRSAGTTYFSADQALDFGYGGFCAVWETNPATSAAFQPSEIAALQYGVKSVT